MKSTSARASHECAAEGCSQQIAIGLLMCIAHWRMVPAPLQREVYRTYRAWRFAAGVVTLATYRKTVAAAVVAVREKEVKRQLKKESHGDVLKLE